MSAMPVDELDPAAMRAAREQIHPAFLGSPQYVHDGLSARLGVPVVVKVDCINPIGAFKGRGTWLLVRTLAGEGRAGPEHPVVAASTGNFGQGIAYAARAFGVPAVVFADERANPAKVARMRSFGATVIQSGRDFDAAREASERWALEHDGVLVVDGREAAVASGAASLAIELTDAADRGELPPLTVASIPVGNGALIVGVGAWLRHAVPECRVVGVQSEAADSMTRSWQAGRPIETETADTFAEGIATRVPVPEALEMMVGRVDEMVVVAEAALREAQAELTEALGVTVEGAAAASWAGLLAGPRPDGPALVLVTGRNVR